MIAGDPKPPTSCVGCGATDTCCATQAAMGGRSCCNRCTHLRIIRRQPGVDHPPKEKP